MDIYIYNCDYCSFLVESLCFWKISRNRLAGCS